MMDVFDAKAVVGEHVEVSADAFADGHDLLRVELRYRGPGVRSWSRQTMTSLANDRWSATFAPSGLGRHEYLVEARTDPFATWASDLLKRVAADQDVTVEVAVGLALVQAAATMAKGKDAHRLAAFAVELSAGETLNPLLLVDPTLADLVAKYHVGLSVSSPTYGVLVERARAGFSTWYELFPRSSGRGKKHGTFVDVAKRLDYLGGLGIDVLYLPPIHPIGTTARKGKDGATTAKAADVGSPWAIGSPDGGHTAIHPDLGTADDLATLVAAAADHGIEVALDLAFQCSPDHPWVTEHPEWFNHRPDGSIRYAENPPKRYEDIYPLDFETEQWRELWDALREVVESWIAHGITIFRVDNPHTKTFAFWEWLIPAVQADHEGVLFLAEAFTRPKIMKRLAKLGFSQSYTYFTWRTEKWELEQYLTELTATEMIDYFRPNFWPNTPDILSEQLQTGDRQTFITRALLAGTLSSNYGTYGPVFELGEWQPRSAGSEEYLHSEKYEIRQFDLDEPRSIAPFLSQLNAIRNQQKALQHNRTLAFHPIDNDQLIAYSKTATGIIAAAGDAARPVLVIANLDPTHPQSGWVDLDLAELGLDADQPYVVHDLLSGARYEWKGHRNFVLLDPATTPGHIFRIENLAVSAE